MTALTTDNAYLASIVQCIAHPEWGTKRFNYDEKYGHHSHGCGCNSALLFESEFKFWTVITFKTPIITRKDRFAQEI